MTTKTFELNNLKPTDTIVVMSKDFKIDFLKELTEVIVYFDNYLKPEYQLYPQKYILENNQYQTTVFELPVRGKNALIVIKSFNDLDLEDIMILKKP